MKKLIIYILITSLTLIMFSCEKDNKEKVDFFKLEDRIGKWVNAEEGDTLEFINDTILKRFYGHEGDYIYRINNNSMYLHLPNSQIETQHDIIESNDHKVKIDKMYIELWGRVSYGIFVKIN